MTAAVAVGSVGAMADAADEDLDDSNGTAVGATAAWRAEIVAAELMAAADAGVDEPTVAPPPRIGRAGAS